MQKLAFKTQRGEAWVKRASRIIISHGLLGKSANWSTVARLLAQHTLLRDKIHEIDMLDMRNHGDSPHLAPHSNAAMASDLELFALQRQIEVSTTTDADEGVVLIGHSMGGLALMAALVRRANEAALLFPDEAELQARCERGDYYGWRDEQRYGQEMRRVNEAMGFAATQPLRDVLFASPSGSSSPLTALKRKGPRVKGAIVVDIAPSKCMGGSESTSKSVVKTLEVMAAVDLSRVHNFSEGARELERLGMEEKHMRDFVLTNLHFEPKTGKARWRCNLPVLLSDFKNVDFGLRNWFTAKHKAQQEQQQQQRKDDLVEPLRCDVPTLFVFGEKSPYNCSAERSLIELFFSNFTRVEVKGAGHFVHYEKMTDFIDVVAPFLAKYL